MAATPEPRGSEWRAGASLAAMDIPQLLGYAHIAGMPAVTGLYTALLPLAAFALLGSSRHLVVAADSATAIVMASALGQAAVPASAAYIALAGALALLVAGLLLLARVLRLGFLADFLSRTVLVGFLAGVGLQVGIAMLGGMLGLAVQARRTLPQLAEIARGLTRIDGQQAVLAVAVLAAVWAGRRFAPRVPMAMLAVIGGIAVGDIWQARQPGIPLLGPVVGGLPSIALPLPAWPDALMLLPVATSCVVIIMAQSAATARSFALRHGERVDADRDLLALAVANAASAASGSFVVNGSPTQTAMAEAAGARSQRAALVFAAVTLAVLLFLTGPLQYLPHCVLAALVFAIALRMIDWRALRDIRAESRGEFRLALLTALAVVALGVEPAILLAMGLSLLRHLRHSYRPHSALLVPDAHGEWQALPCRPGQLSEPGVLVYRFGADLFYANAQRFVDELQRLVAGAPADLHAVVVDASAIERLDYSAAQSLRVLFEQLQRRRVRVVLGRVGEELHADLQRHRVAALLGTAHLHPSLRAALADARSGGTGDEVAQDESGPGAAERP